MRHTYKTQIRNMILQALNDYVEAKVKEEQKNFKLHVPPEIMTRFITGGFVFALSHLIEDQTNYSKKQLVKYADEILSSFLIA